MKNLISAAALTVALITPAFAQTWSSNAPRIGSVNQPEGIYIPAYPVSVNHCHPGYQPVVFGGRISCGKPLSGASSTSAPVASAASCAEGAKGCG